MSQISPTRSTSVRLESTAAIPGWSSLIATYMMLSQPWLMRCCSTCRMTQYSCWVTDGQLIGGAVERLQSVVSLDSISTLVLTHLTPKRLASLQAFLQARGTTQPLEVYLSNPAHQLLRSKLGAGPMLSSNYHALALSQSWSFAVSTSVLDCASAL